MIGNGAVFDVLLYADGPAKYNGYLQADDVQVTAGTGAVAEIGIGLVLVANSMIDGPVVGTPRCVGAYSGVYIALSTSCA